MTTCAYRHWEGRVATPGVRLLPRVVAVLGYDPVPMGDGLPSRLRALRRRLGLTQVEAAVQLGMSVNRMNELILGKRGVTADTALRLARRFGTTAQLWMHLQADWELHEAIRKNPVSRPAGRPAATARRPPTAFGAGSRA